MSTEFIFILLLFFVCFSKEKKTKEEFKVLILPRHKGVAPRSVPPSCLYVFHSKRAFYFVRLQIRDSGNLEWIEMLLERGITFP